MALISFLFLFTHTIAQKVSLAQVLEGPIAQRSRQPDTATQNHLNRLLQLPPQLKAISRKLIYKSAGETFKSSWTIYEPQKRATMQAFINRVKPIDKLILTTFYVLKGDKRMILADYSH